MHVSMCAFLSVAMTCFPNAFLFHWVARVFYNCVCIYIYIRMYIQQLFTHAHTHKWFVQTIELIPIPIPQRKTQHILPSVCSSMFFQATRCHTEISSNQRLYHVHVPAPNRKSSTDQSASPPWQGHKRNPTGRTCSSK